jgi:hypothetical protein
MERDAADRGITLEAPADSTGPVDADPEGAGFAAMAGSYGKAGANRKLGIVLVRPVAAEGRWMLSPAYCRTRPRWVLIEVRCASSRRAWVSRIGLADQRVEPRHRRAGRPARLASVAPSSAAS